MNPYLIILTLFSAAFLSGLAVLFVKKDSSTFLKLVLSFSGAYLFGLTILHLIPHVYQHAGTNMETIGLYILGGFLFQLILEQFSQGVEHGHVHIDRSKIAPFPIAVLISLCLHGFLEGMPLVAKQQTQLVFGIAIHHIPAAFALGSLLLAAKVSRSTLLACIGLFAIMTPLGFLFSKAVSEHAIGNIAQHFDKMMAIVIGIFLHVSTTILFESGSPDHHTFNRKKMLAVLVGILLSLTTLLFGGHDHHHHDDGPSGKENKQEKQAEHLHTDEHIHQHDQQHSEEHEHQH
ncbi:ZIP family metal transporter [Sphingobacterium oryzagri]|uniref:ZIP family metal transporter n=1 Tax=Sphingobacterium oryzagri TaxID=3025669 RepID=UPI0030824B7C